MPQRCRPPLIQRDDKGLVPSDRPETAFHPTGAIVAASANTQTPSP